MAIDKITTPAVTDANITSGKIADDAITLAKMAPGTDGQIITYDASGNPVAVGPGTDGQVLTSTGAGSPPAFETPASATNTPNFSAYVGSNTSIANTTTFTVPMNSERWDTASAFNSSDYSFTVPSGQGGKYNMTFKYLLSGTFTCRIVGYFVVNGSDKAGMQMQHNSVDTAFIINASLLLSASDVVKVSAYQDSGSSRTLLGGTVFSEFSGFKIIE